MPETPLRHKTADGKQQSHGLKTEENIMDGNNSKQQTSEQTAQQDTTELKTSAPNPET